MAGSHQAKNARPSFACPPFRQATVGWQQLHALARCLVKALQPCQRRGLYPPISVGSTSHTERRWNILWVWVKIKPPKNRRFEYVCSIYHWRVPGYLFLTHTLLNSGSLFR